MSIEVFTGDDWDIVVTLKKNSVAFDASGGVIKSAVVKKEGKTNSQVIADVTMSEVATGADWANGVVVLEFSSAQTAITDYGTLYLEIQVDKASKKTTWPLQPITVIFGSVA